jgi:uncharacterized membrane protein
MGTLTVWEFDTATGADEAEATLARLAKMELIKIHDAATVSWPVGRNKPKTRQLNNLVGAGALGGAFWGLLFGLIFLVPLLGMAVGAAAGAIGGSLADVGIDDDFIRSIRDTVKFVMTSDAVIDKVHEEFRGMKAELIHTNLSKEQEDKLREVFAEPD